MAKKESGPKEMYLNWAGWTASPETEPDVFYRLPVPVQREKLHIRQLLKDHPEARPYAIYDPHTRLPYPGQVLLDDIIRKEKDNRQALPEVPTWFKYGVPNGVPVSLFSLSSAGEKWTNEQTKEAMERLENHTTENAVLSACTKEGHLLLVKPVDGIYAFIWRVARFCSGLDTFIPVTAFLDLEDGLARFGIRMPDEESLQPLLKHLQEVAHTLVNRSGGDKDAAAVRYGKAVGLIP